MKAEDYYKASLAAERLQRVYEVASARVRQYLQAEINHVLSRIRPGDKVLELGCGYGRIIPQLATRAGHVVGIDNSYGSLLLAQNILRSVSNCDLACMNALPLGFVDGSFDLVACIQNGISAFHVDQGFLIAEALRVTKIGGSVLFSSYSNKFWDERLAWFQQQADEGLLGEIDMTRSSRGVIVCKDGFTATTLSPDDFRELAQSIGVATEITEVDQSSVFCEIVKN